MFWYECCSEIDWSRRQHGGGVPEHWGRDSPYHPGTNFLGTPPDHLEVRAGRLHIVPPTFIPFNHCTAVPSLAMLHTVSHLVQRVKKRPVSPHVFEADGSKFHYAMPINAITSILNRATGVALTVGKPCGEAQSLECGSGAIPAVHPTCCMEK